MTVGILAEATSFSTFPESIRADRLILATNRGPVEYYMSRDNKLKSRRGAGGLVTALTGTESGTKMTWVSLAMTDGDRIAAREAQQQGQLLQSPLPGLKMELRYVVVPRTIYRKHYEQISNQVLYLRLPCERFDSGENEHFPEQSADFPAQRGHAQTRGRGNDSQTGTKLVLSPLFEAMLPLQLLTSSGTAR